MVLKLNTKVEFCGKARKFKRCPNRVLVDNQKAMEDIQNRLIPLGEQNRDIQFEITELQDRINSIEEYVDFVKNFDDASDDEIREAMSLVKEKTSLQKKIHELRRTNDDAELENRAIYKELDEELRGIYANFASLIFEDFDVNEIEEVDSTDLEIAPRLPELYRLATTGVKQKEIDKAYQKIIKQSFR